MLDGIKGSAKATSDKIDTDKIKDQAADLASVLSDGAHQAGEKATVVAGQAREAALQAKDWGTPKVEAFVEWVTPRLEQAWNESVKAAAPAVEKAAGKASPVIDSAHDKLVDDLFPKIVAALNDAAKNAADATRTAADATGEGASIVASKASAGASHVAESIKAASEKAPIKLSDAVHVGTERV